MLSKVVQQSVEEFEENIPEEVGEDKRYGYKHIQNDYTHTVTDWGFLKKDLISSHISLIEAEIARKKKIMKAITSDARLFRQTFTESGYKHAIQEDIQYLEGELELIKKMV